jgi:hypothetical protein
MVLVRELGSPVHSLKLLRAVLISFPDRATLFILYWAVLEFACQGGYHRFDFGRSTRDQGTFRFKQQWGAAPEGLDWRRRALPPAAPALPQ